MITEQWFRLGGLRCSPLNAALGVMKKLVIATAILILLAASVSASETLWREDKNAEAYCKLINETVCTVVVVGVFTDVSAIENKNIGKLGITPKEKYEKVITFPSKWLRSNSRGDLIEFTTQAWLQGQRYTVNGMVFVDSNGKYVHQ